MAVLVPDARPFLLAPHTAATHALGPVADAYADVLERFGYSF